MQAPDDPLPTAVAAERRRLRAPAMGAALVEPSAVRVAVAGVRARGGADAVTPGDRWHIGSCAKALTALLLARLAEDGLLAWGAPVASLLPDAAAGADPGWARVTIDDVLRHRAGLPADMGAAEMLAAHGDPRPAAVQRAEVAARALAAPPDHPGRFRYSNLGYVVAGAVVEELTGEPWEDALRDRLLVPLGVASHGFGPPGDAGPAGHLPRLVRLGAGRGRPVDPGAPWADNPPVMGPAGRLTLTLDGWGRVVAQFLEGGATLVTPASIGHLLTVPEGPGPPAAMGWLRPGPLRPGHPLRGASYAHQGSNRSWSATAALDGPRRRAALVVANDGRARVLAAGPALAGRLLAL